jgi:hypothetical protein
METAEDPIAAMYRRMAAEREARQQAKLMKALGPVVIVPSPQDVALGYRFIVPEDSTLPRNAKTLRNGLRKAGWWAYVNMVAAVIPAKPATEKIAAKPAALVYSYGMHGFSAYPPHDGDTGIVAYWSGRDGFAWAARADYRDGTYYKTYIGYPAVSALLKGMAA